MYGLADVRHSTKSVPWGYSIVLAADAGPRVPSGGVTLKRRCTYRPSVIYSCWATSAQRRCHPEEALYLRPSVIYLCWATSAQRRCHPEEALYLPTFSHLFDCQ